MSKIKGLIALFWLGFLAWLVISASQGNTESIAILAVLAAVVLILLGVGIAVLVIYALARREEARFIQNTRENLAMMTAMQRIQNQQNALLLKQAREAHWLLPAGEVPDSDALAMDESVFDELEE
jgi:uncharacterized membrane protein